MSSSISNVKSELVGTWKLVSYQSFPDGATPLARQYGDGYIGRVIFTMTGHMAAILSCKHANPPTSQDWRLMPDSVIASFARGLNGYSGPYRLYHDDNGAVMLQTEVEVAVNPAWIGGLQKRYIKIEEKDGEKWLILTPVQHIVLEVSKIFSLF